MPSDVRGKTGPGARGSPGVVGSPGDKGRWGAVEIDCEPGTACVCSKVMVGSGMGLGGISLNRSIRVLRVLCGRRGWHSRHGLNVFDVLDGQTLKCLMCYLVVKSLG